MVQEKFLQQAISIRRTYLKLLNSMDLYKSRAMKVSERLQETLGKLEDFQKDLSKDDKNMDKSEILSKLIGIIDEIQDEGTRLEKLIEPINFEIEKLAKEEEQLYRLIVESHPGLSEEQIVKSVRDRLISEGLS